MSHRVEQLIDKVRERESTRRKIALSFVGASILSVSSVPLALWLWHPPITLIASLPLGAVIAWTLRSYRWESPAVTTDDVSRIIDETLSAKERVQTLTHLAANDTARRMFIARQIESILPPHFTAANLVSFTLTKQQRLLIGISVTSLLTAVSLYFLRPTAPLALAANTIAAVVAEHPELPSSVVSAADELVEQISSGASGDEIRESLQRTEKAISEALAQVASGNKRKEKTIHLSDEQRKQQKPSQERLEDAQREAPTPVEDPARKEDLKSSPQDPERAKEQRANQSRQERSEKREEPSQQGSTKGEKQPDPSQQEPSSQRDQSDKNEGASDSKESDSEKGNSEQGAADQKNEQGRSDQGSSGEKNNQQGGESGKSSGSQSGQSEREGEGGGAGGGQGSKGSGSQGGGSGQQGGAPSTDPSDEGAGQGEGAGKGTSKGAQGSGGSDKSASQQSGSQGGASGKDQTPSGQSGLSELQQAVQQAKDALGKESGASQGDAENKKQEGSTGSQGSAGSGGSQNKQGSQSPGSNDKQKNADSDAAQRPKGEGSKGGTRPSAQGDSSQGAEHAKSDASKDGSDQQGENRDGDAQGGDTKNDRTPPPSTEKQDPRTEQRKSDSTGTGSGEQSAIPDRSAQAVPGGPGEGPPSDGSQVARGFKESEVGANDEKFDARFTGEESTNEQNKGPAGAKTSLEEVLLAKPKGSQQKERQPIPLEYRDVLE